MYILLENIYKLVENILGVEIEIQITKAIYITKFSNNENYNNLK